MDMYHGKMDVTATSRNSGAFLLALCLNSQNPLPPQIDFINGCAS